MKKIFILLIILMGFVGAADFTPQGNINLRDTYNITGAPYVNATLYYGNGSQLTGIVALANYSTYANSSDYWDDYDSASDLNDLITIQGENISAGTIDFDRLPTLTNMLTLNWANITSKFITAVDNSYIYMLSTTATLNETKLNETIELLDTDTTYTAGTNLTLTGTTFSLNTTGVTDWLDSIYAGIGTIFDGAYSSLTGKPTVLSNFTDDLGNRGYTDLLNFTNTPGYLTSYTETDSLAYNGTLAYNSSLSNYAPYTGATQNIDIGGYNLTSSWLKANNLNITGNAYIGEMTWNGNLDLNGNNLVLNGGYVSGDGGDEGVYVASDGNVGIGTGSPAAPVHINKSWIDSHGQLQITGESGAASGITFYEGIALGGWIYHDGATNDLLLQSYNSGSYGDLALNYMGGNVGIGTGSPQQPLHVAGNALINGTLDMDDGAITNIDWSSSDDGAGSGLDADLLDGLNSATFYNASNPAGYTSNTGTVTSVSGTAPISVATGTTTPVISIAADGINDTHLAYDTGQDLTTTSSPTFATTLISNYIDMDRHTNTRNGISWYSPSFTAWADYMSDPGASTGPTGTITAPSGTYVTSWAKRDFIEATAGYGWTWESGTSTTTTPAVKFEIRSSDGYFHGYGGGDIDGALNVDGGINAGLAIFGNSDIYTTGAGDDLWLGALTQGDALFKAYANGSVVANDYVGDGSGLTGLRLDSWDNITGIPHATPSNGDTTHFSLADEIYDWVISLSYLADLSDDTSPQLGGYLDTAGNDIGSTSDEIENVYVGDTTRIYFGDGQDASMYFNGTNLIITG